MILILHFAHTRMAKFSLFFNVHGKKDYPTEILANAHKAIISLIDTGGTLSTKGDDHVGLHYNARLFYRSVACAPSVHYK